VPRPKAQPCLAGVRRRAIHWGFVPLPLALAMAAGTAGRTAARNLCNVSLRIASGPEGSSPQQLLACAAGPPGCGGVRATL